MKIGRSVLAIAVADVFLAGWLAGQGFTAFAAEYDMNGMANMMNDGAAMDGMMNGMGNMTEMMDHMPEMVAFMDSPEGRQMRASCQKMMEAMDHDHGAMAGEAGN